MARKSLKDLIVGIDIGTSKIVALVGQIQDDNQIQIIGKGTHPSRGLKRGVVVDIESTVQSIKRAAEEAELMAGCQIHSAFTGIAGNHIRSLNSHGIVAIRDREVTAVDVDRVIDAAKAVAIPADQKVLHILPQEFVVDEQNHIREPIGMSGVRLEAKVHLVTGAVSAAENIVKCVRKCGLKVSDIILEQLASSYSVLTQDEQDLGVCLVDVGAGTTDIAIFTQGAIRHTAVIPIAGDQVTNDVAVALRTPTASAEEIKVKYGSACSQTMSEDDTVDVPAAGNQSTKSMSRKFLAQVIEARYEELFSLVNDELRRSGFDNLIPAGIVLTGGASKVQGVLELAESVFKMPVHLGVPRNVTGIDEVSDNPVYATSVGLLLYGYQQRRNNLGEMVPHQGGLRGVMNRMKHWFHGNF